MGDVLSQQEIDELNKKEHAVETPADHSRDHAYAYDFKHPARVNRTQLRAMESLHENFARLLGSTFSLAMRELVSVDTAFVDQTTYREFIASLPNPACTYQFTLGPTTGRVLLDVSMPLVFAAVDRTFGGKGSSQEIAPRQLTAIEMGVINKILKRMIEDLEATWEPLLRVEISNIELETNPEFIQATTASEIVILLAFEVNTPNASGLISLCYPYFTLESILPLLGPPAHRQRTPASEERLLLDNRLRLGPMELPMVAELGRVKIPVGEVESLRAGDILRLPARAGEPAVVYLGGKPKYWAHPFAEENGELKLQVAGPIPAHEQGQYGTVR